MSELVLGLDPNNNLVAFTVDAFGNLKIVDTANPPAAVLTGVTNVTTAGTAVALAPSAAAKSVTIKAKIANTGTIYVGNSGVSSTTGFPLLAGDTVSLNIADLSSVWLDCSVNGEGVSYLGVN